MQRAQGFEQRHVSCVCARGDVCTSARLLLLLLSSSSSSSPNPGMTTTTTTTTTTRDGQCSCTPHSMTRPSHAHKNITLSNPYTTKNASHIAHASTARTYGSFTRHYPPLAITGSPSWAYMYDAPSFSSADFPQIFRSHAGRPRWLTSWSQFKADDAFSSNGPVLHRRRC